MNLEKALLNSVHKTGRFIRKNAFEFGNLDWKKIDDPVTELDKKAERMIKKELSQHATFNFIGEEYGYENNNSDLTAIIDPIDGTKSFTRADFLSSISVALEVNKKLHAGCVYDFMRDITYFSFDNKYCILHNNKEVKINVPKYSKIRVGFKGNNHKPIVWFDNHPRLDAIIKEGSVALNLAHLSAGNYDAFVAFERKRSNTHDIAAGYHLLKTTGHKVYDLDGNKFDYKNPNNGMIAVKPTIDDKEVISHVQV